MKYGHVKVSQVLQTRAIDFIIYNIAKEEKFTNSLTLLRKFYIESSRNWDTITIIIYKRIFVAGVS